MRLIDFFVFYQTTLYKSPEEANKSGNKRLPHAVHIAGFIITSWIVSLILLIILFAGIITPMGLTIFKVAYIALSIPVILQLRHIYISNKRYESVILQNYQSFKLSKATANIFIFFIFMISIALAVTMLIIVE